MMEAKKILARWEAIEHWQERLPHVRVGLRMAMAIGSVLKEWMGRGHRGLSFHTTQVLSGHGCFGYLHEKIPDASPERRQGGRSKRFLQQHQQGPPLPP